jgi:hypothetical protein
LCTQKKDYYFNTKVIDIMRKLRMKALLLAIVFFLYLPLWAQQGIDISKPRQVVLTWQNNPSTTMTITWRTSSPEGKHILRYATGQYRFYKTI